jgi:hypothetical protein
MAMIVGGKGTMAEERWKQKIHIIGWNNNYDGYYNGVDVKNLTMASNSDKEFGKFGRIAYGTWELYVVM